MIATKKRKTIATTWRKPPEWSHIPGEPTRPPLVPSWAKAVAGGKPVPPVPIVGYQEQYLSLPDRFVAWLASRQIGKSWTAMLKQVFRVHQAEQRKLGHRAIVFSSGKEPALEDIRYAIMHSRAIETWRQAEMAIAESEESYEPDPEQNRYAKYSIDFPGTGLSSIAAIAANPWTAVGRNAHVVGDEVARWRDPRAVWDAIVPFVTRGGVGMDLFSTPFGVSNLWHDLCTRPEHYGLKLLVTTIWDAIQDIEIILHLLPEAQAEQLRIDPAQLYKLCGDDKVWAQNYLCQFLDLLSTLLGLDMIAACETSGTLWSSIAEGREGSASRILFFGWDVARKRDLSIAWVLELLGDVLVTRWIETMQKMRLPDQQKIVDTIIGLPGMRRGLIDETGMGLAVKEFSEDRFGSIRIGGVTFTGPARVEMSKHLQAKFQDRKIRIPNDPMIRDDLRLVKKEDTLSSERIVIEEGGESHADRFWALALAIYAAYEWTTSGSRAPATAPTSVSPSHLTGRINQPNVSLAAKLLTRAA